MVQPCIILNNSILLVFYARITEHIIDDIRIVGWKVNLILNLVLGTK